MEGEKLQTTRSFTENKPVFICECLALWDKISLQIKKILFKVTGNMHQELNCVSTSQLI